VLHALPTVSVVDDDVAVRDVLEKLIRREGWQPQMFATARDFLSRAPTAGPACLVLEATLPDLDGLDLQQHIGARPDLPIIFIAGDSDVSMAVQAMKAGAVDFLTKPLNAYELLNAIRHALERSELAVRRRAALQTLQQRHASLSRREREVMALVIAGRLNKHIADELGISEVTVKAHRGKVMRKMRAGTLVDLVNIAASLSLVPGRNTSGARTSGNLYPSLQSAAGAVLQG
jgi:FixJ family two-component response regulator